MGAREDKKQRQKLRQALLRELDALRIDEATAKGKELVEINMRRKAIGKKLSAMVDKRTKPKIEPTGVKEIEVNKQETPWVRQKATCEKNGISRTLFASRIKRGMCEKAAATTPRDPKPFTDEQRRIMTENGISYALAKNRLNSLTSWTMEEIITTKPGERPRTFNFSNGEKIRKEVNE